MGIDYFDVFPLPEPPLVDDPFTSLSATDLAAMEAAAASGSECEDDGEGDEDDDECTM
jgi:hypothetical protein